MEELQTNRQISDHTIYLNRMNASLQDKLYFLEYINFDALPDKTNIIDFGCADGALLNYLHDLYPRFHYIGVENNEYFVELLHNDSPFITVYSAISDVHFPEYDMNILILSSVLHELYTYHDADYIQTFWSVIIKNTFDYICIRDMFPDIAHDDKKISDEWAKKLTRKSLQSQLSDYESIWGKIENEKQLAHFLLKYKYTENWDREVRENYFPIELENVIRLLPVNYSILYKESYILPYIKEQLQKDFGLALNYKTHGKIIFKKLNADA